MTIHDLQALGTKIDSAYIQSGEEKQYKTRTPLVYCGFLLTDLGELVEQVMAHEKYRDGEDVKAKIEHELADCLWALLMLAKHLDVDIEKAYSEMIRVVEKRQELGTAG
jgi:NTP pyrophosphatase (non-canonical NTP hydrolase)